MTAEHDVPSAEAHVEPTAPPGREPWWRAASAARRVVDALVGADAPGDEVAAVAQLLEDAAGRIEGFSHRSPYEAFLVPGLPAEQVDRFNPHAIYDHNPLVGRANPLSPPLRLWRDGDRVRGTVRFGSAYEGPPGCVHGGVVAATFDEVLGLAQVLSGIPGMTGTLTVRYVAPTPLHTDLDLDAGLDGVEGRKVMVSARMTAGDATTAQATGIFVSIDRDRFGELVERSRRR